MTTPSLIDTSIELFACPRCAHLQTNVPSDVLAAFFDRDFDYLLKDEDEDEPYDFVGGRTIGRNEHQIAVLRSTLELGMPHPKSVLDFGCGKGLAMRLLQRVVKNADVHLFEVSDRYVPWWGKIADPTRWATYDVPPDWSAKFDLVTSFYVLLHVPDPIAVLSRLRAACKPDGIVWCVVPNVDENPGDLVCADVAHHFSATSLAHAFARAGLLIECVDAEAHRGSFCVRARPSTAGPQDGQSDATADERARARRLGEYWTGVRDAIAAFEAAHQGPAAVYGAGVYGAHILASLGRPERVRCFVDRAEHRQGSALAGHKVVAPSELPSDVETVYVGLRPQIAAAAIAAAFPDRALHTFTLPSV